MPTARFLVLRFSSLGDVILTTPLIRCLRTAFAEADITVGTKARYAPVFQNNAGVDRVAALVPGQSLAAYARELAAPDLQIVDLHGSLRTRALERRIGGRWTRYRTHRAPRALQVWTGLAPGRQTPPVADRYFAAVRHLGIVPDGKPPELFPSDADRAAAGNIVSGDYVVLAPGASRATRRWPAGHWDRVAEGLEARGVTPVGVGTADERQLLTSGRVRPGWGTPIGVAAALCRGARALVACDSAFVHVASACRTPTIALYGPTSPDFGFRPYDPSSRVLQRDLPCRPCSAYGGDHCPLDHHRCLHDVSPGEVITAVESSL